MPLCASGYLKMAGASKLEAWGGAKNALATVHGVSSHLNTGAKCRNVMGSVLD